MLFLTHSAFVGCGTVCWVKRFPTFRSNVSSSTSSI